MTDEKTPTKRVPAAKGKGKGAARPSPAPAAKKAKRAAKAKRPAKTSRPATPAPEGVDAWPVIRRLMKDKGWILQELIRRSGITRTTFFNIQHGKSRGSYETYVKIARAFGVEVDVLLGRAAYPEGIGESVWTGGALPEGQRNLRVGSVSYIRVPVVKAVRHDEPPETPENIVETMFLSAANASPDDFLLVVDGDGMAPEILRGDIAHVRRNAVVKSGDIVCVAFTDGGPGVVRAYRAAGDAHEFIARDGGKPVRKKDAEFILYGKVVKITRPL